ncbi:MAG TPA: type III pantothenate kinase [Rhodanobacteraceae bacterium]
MRLLLDLGNTRVKWGVVDATGGVVDMHAHAWPEVLNGALEQDWTHLPHPHDVWLASVVDDARRQSVARSVEASLGQSPRWVSTPAAGCGVRIAYAEPQTLGVDRFLGMVAAHADGRSPCILVSAGTALVLDALAGDGRHLGGLIAPGAGLMQQSVLGATAKVRPQSPGRLGEAGASTADALVSGCWQACAALVDRFATRMADALDDVPTLLLSGGDAGTLASLLEHPVTMYPDAVLKGLATWAACEA